MGKSEIVKNRGHIDVLNGIRAIAVLIVVWFHFWQQTWLSPKGFFINLDWLPRTGFEMVDMMILLSGFCLFLPHARSMIEGTVLPDNRQFYKKRVARIIPSYLLCIFVILFAFNLPLGRYASLGAMIKDVLTHLTFTNTFFSDTYYTTNLNTVLWTIAIEVQFYLIFPYIAKKFRKHPIYVYFIMQGAALLFNSFIIYNYNRLPFYMYMNQLPTFLGVYANGMLGALIFVAMSHKRKKKGYEGILFTALSLLCIYIYGVMMKQLVYAPVGNIWQVRYRFQVSLVFTVFIISTAFALDTYKWLFSNKLMVFLSEISFNLYIWHAFIAVQLKEFRIPYWEGEQPPNITGDKVWQWKYFILICLFSIGIATAVTYVFEKPTQRKIMESGKQS